MPTDLVAHLAIIHPCRGSHLLTSIYRPPLRFGALLRQMRCHLCHVLWHLNQLLLFLPLGLHHPDQHQYMRSSFFNNYQHSGLSLS